MPNVLNGVQVGRLRGPCERVNAILLHPELGVFGRVNRGIVLDKNGVLGKRTEEWEKMFLEQLAVALGVDLTLGEKDNRTQVLADKTAPHHHTHTSALEAGSKACLFESLTWLPPDHDLL